MMSDRRARFLLDATLLGVAIVTGVVARRPVRPLGDEDRRPLPGDDLLAVANGRWTHAITIHAQPSDVWPWLAQMGCRRAGWYSYDGLDNGGLPSADRILPTLQRVEVGDLFPWAPTADDGFIVWSVEHGQALVLGGTAGSLYRVTWAFVLERIDDMSTRLLTRASAEYTHLAVAPWLWLIMRPIHFGMQRKQLLNLKASVEASGGTRREH
jgi:hypothetical protein